MVTAAEAIAMLPHSLALAGQIGSASIGASASERNNKANNDAKLAELIKGKQLDRENSEAEFNKVQSAAQDAAGHGRHVSAKMGNSSYMENEPDVQGRLAAHQHNMENGQMAKLYKEAQNTVKPIDTQLNSMSMLHSLLDNPNAVDQKALGAGLARLAEGNGQRLLQTLVHEMGAPSSVAGDSQASANWLMGQAKSGLTAAQSNAMRQHLFKHQAEIEQQLSDGKQTFGQGSAYIAPDVDPEKRMGAIGAATMHSDNVLKQLNARREAWKKEQGPAVASPGSVPQVAQPQTLMDKAGSGLAGFLQRFQPGGGQPAAPQAPGVPSFEEFKRMKAAGQIK